MGPQSLIENRRLKSKSPFKFARINSQEVKKNNINFWKIGDVCGKKVTSCAMRFQAKVNGSGGGAGFDELRDSRISLPFGGFPGVVQRR